MRQTALNWGLGALAATVGLVVARSLAPGRHDIELDVFVLVLGLMALLSMAAVLRKIAPPEGESRLASALEPRAREVAQIPELARLERELKMGAAREFDLHYRLRPVVREIAIARLEQRGARLDSGSAGVRELLGEELWELVSAEREPPSDRLAPGPGLAQLRRTVERLERL